MKTKKQIIISILALCITISCNTKRHAANTNTNSERFGRLIVKEFPIDPNNKNASQIELEAEQLRLMKKYPDLNLTGIITPNSPWILATECQSEKVLLEIKKQLTKDCPDAKIVKCD